METRILIVDDERAICSMLAQRLSKEGYSYATANNGIEALQQFYKEKFSLIISDIKMPVMDGLELLRSVKTVNPNMIVTIMTAYPEIGMAVEAMRQGANDFLIKPVDLDLLVLSVKNVLEKKRLEEELEAYHKNLETLVKERTSELQQALLVVKKDHLDSVKLLAEVIEARDLYTRGHSDRVRRLSMRIAMKLGFDEKRLESLVFGALLHDIGKVGIKDEVLHKNGPLSSAEYEHVKQHPLIGAKILEGNDFFKDKIPMIRNHHERYDGSGYPDGLIGESIPLEARIIAVSDAFDALTSLRPHHGAIPIEDALLEMEKWKGKQFDPDILGMFVSQKIYMM